MTIWIDAQLSPSLADWITDVFAILASTLQQALELLNAGETLVEITGTESTRASNLQE